MIITCDHRRIFLFWSSLAACHKFCFCLTCLSLLPRVLIARGHRAYRSRAVCLSLVGRPLIARGPSAYRSSGVVDNCTTKVQHLGRHNSGRVRQNTGSDGNLSLEACFRLSLFSVLSQITLMTQIYTWQKRQSKIICEICAICER